MSCDDGLVAIDDCDTPTVLSSCEDETVVVISCERGPAGPAGPPGTIDPWDVTVSYPADSVVSFEGDLYVALRSTVGDAPDVSPSDWQLVGSPVESVNSQTGVVELDAADIPYDPSYGNTVTSNFWSPTGDYDDVQTFTDHLIDGFVNIASQVALLAAEVAGLGDPEKLLRNINKTAHGLSVGQVVYLSGGSESGAGTYVLSQADSELHAQVDGIVIAVTDANNFTLWMSGYMIGLSGLAPAALYYLSPTVPGALTATKPSATGQVVKPLLRAIGSTRGELTLLNYSYVISDVSEDDFIALAVAL
jgi:hypothetical protein